MIGHLNSTLEGLTTIRASNVQERLIQEFDNHQNLFTSANYMLNNCQIALGFGLEFFCTVFITLVIIQFLITTSGMYTRSFDTITYKIKHFRSKRG